MSVGSLGGVYCFSGFVVCGVVVVEEMEFGVVVLVVVWVVVVVGMWLWGIVGGVCVIFV